SFQILLDKSSADKVGPGHHRGVRLHLNGDVVAAIQRTLHLSQPFPFLDVPKRKADPNSKRICGRTEEGDLLGECESSEDEVEPLEAEADVEATTVGSKSAEKLLNLTSEERDNLWEFKLERSQMEARKAWRTPPGYVK
ncbi:unnamed protein product, partial [Prorocentrum cordatum]